MRNKGNFIRAALPLAMIVMTACQDSSGPGSSGELNTTVALADYAAMDAVRQSAGWRGFQMAAPAMGAKISSARTGLP